MSNSTESEFKFWVNDQAAGVIENFIKNTDSLLRYQLGLCNEIINHDYYFDTIDRILSKNKASLRFRNQGQNRFLITYKSDIQAIDRGAANATEGFYKRLEIEGIPDAETLRKIQIQLRNIGLSASNVDDEILIMEGVQGVFALWGFERLFELENQRIARSILNSNSLIGEITFDRVHLEGDHHHSVFYEVEIEAKADSTSEAIAEIAEFLKTRFPAEITPSLLSKYERGLEFVGAEEHHKKRK